VVASAVPKLRILIAGVGHLQGEIEQAIKSLGLEERVVLLGLRSDVPALMSIASLLLLTSTHEGMPNVVMEAQVLGLPVVATRTGGTPDIVADGVTGYVRVVGDVPQLAEACIAILRDSSLRTQMQTACRIQMGKLFSKQVMVDRYIALASVAEVSRFQHDQSQLTGKGEVDNTACRASTRH
jgi:glycosyltransferase involved in cell wall biosynthesis